MAILLAEAGLLADCELIGTDCRPEAIRHASQGRFSHEATEQVSQEWGSKWFAADRSGLTIDDRLRASIRWKQADLFAGTESGPWHLLLWRNMAIYLEPAAASSIWHALVAELAPGGWLITGKADYPPPGLGLVRVAPCIYQKVQLCRP